MPLTDCCALGCTNRKGSKGLESRISFHRIPRNQKLRQQWLKAIGREDFTSLQGLVCSEHFKEADIDRTSLCMVRVRENAVPTILFPQEASSPSKPSEQTVASMVSMIVNDSEKEKGQLVLDVDVKVEPSDECPDHNEMTETENETDEMGIQALAAEEPKTDPTSVLHHVLMNENMCMQILPVKEEPVEENFPNDQAQDKTDVGRENNLYFQALPLSSDSESLGAFSLSSKKRLEEETSNKEKISRMRPLSKKKRMMKPDDPPVKKTNFSTRSGRRATLIDLGQKKKKRSLDSYLHNNGTSLSVELEKLSPEHLSKYGIGIETTEQKEVTSRMDWDEEVPGVSSNSFQFNEEEPFAKTNLKSIGSGKRHKDFYMPEIDSGPHLNSETSLEDKMNSSQNQLASNVSVEGYESFMQRSFDMEGGDSQGRAEESVKVYVFYCGHACSMCNTFNKKWLAENGFNTIKPLTTSMAQRLTKQKTTQAMEFQLLQQSLPKAKPTGVTQSPACASSSNAHNVYPVELYSHATISPHRKCPPENSRIVLSKPIPYNSLSGASPENIKKNVYLSRSEPALRRKMNETITTVKKENSTLEGNQSDAETQIDRDIHFQETNETNTVS